jgi:hypothetical protein
MFTGQCVTLAPCSLNHAAIAMPLRLSDSKDCLNGLSFQGSWRMEMTVSAIAIVRRVMSAQ